MAAQAFGSTSLCFDAFRLDPVCQRFWRGTEPVALRSKAFCFLHFLLEHPQRVVSHQELLHAVWEGASVSDSLLRGYVRELRQALGDDCTRPRFIETVPARGYRFVAEVTRLEAGLPPSPARAQHVASSASHLSGNVVGREAELALLDGWLRSAIAGERQVVFVRGEAGIGKTTLLQAFLERADQEEVLWISRGQCVEWYGTGEAYLPVLDGLGRLCRAPGNDQVTEILERHAPTWLVQMPGLLTETSLESLQRKIAGATRGRMLRELAEAVEILGERRPVILALEDLQWSDPSTADLISLLARRREPARLMVIGTCRAADLVCNSHPLKRITEELKAHHECRDVVLGALDEAAVARYIGARFAHHSFPPALATALHASSEGNPLFMVAMTDDLVGRRVVTDSSDGWRLSRTVDDVAIEAPESLRDLIGGTIDRLTEREQVVLEASAVAGAEFTTAAVGSALLLSPEDVQIACESLVRRRQILRRSGAETWPDGTVSARYTVAHALYHQVALERCQGRDQSWHQRIGERIEAGHRGREADVASELALHFERAADHPRAVRYHAVVGERAARRFAHAEAVAHFMRGIDLLRSRADGADRDGEELRLRTALAQVLIAMRGFASPELEANNARVLVLMQNLGPRPHLFPVFYGLYLQSVMQAKYARAGDVCGQMEEITQQECDPGFLGPALAARGSLLLCTGEVSSARNVLERARATYESARDRSPQGSHFSNLGVNANIQLAIVDGILGYPAQALKAALRALEIARETSSPYQEVTALTCLARTHRFRRESSAAAAIAESAMAMAMKHTFVFWHGEAAIVRGWALAAGGCSEGVSVMEEGLSERLSAAHIGTSSLQVAAAETYLTAGDTERGLRAIDVALEFARAHGERTWECEAHRMRARLLLEGLPGRLGSRESQLAQAEAAAVRALELARAGAAKTFELRAAKVLHRIWTERGKRAAADELLAGISGWFDEGHDLLDLQEARTLLGHAGQRYGDTRPAPARAAR